MSGLSTQDTELLRSSDGGTTWVEVVDLTSVGLPDGTVPEQDTSVLKSQSKEWISGLRDEGTVNFSVNFDASKTSHQQMVADKKSGTEYNWKIRVKDSANTYAEWTFPGFVNSFGGDFAVDQVQNLSGSIRVSGPVSEAYGVA